MASTKQFRIIVTDKTDSKNPKILASYIRTASSLTACIDKFVEPLYHEYCRDTLTKCGKVDATAAMELTKKRIHIKAEAVKTVSASGVGSKAHATYKAKRRAAKKANRKQLVVNGKTISSVDELHALKGGKVA